jgi:hypothetical protein
MAKPGSVIIVATSERHSNAGGQARERGLVEKTTKPVPQSPDCRLCEATTKNGEEPGERLEGRIISAWPIALCARASPARNAESGSSFDRKASSRSAKKNPWRVALRRNVERSLNSNQARLEFSTSRYHFSSAVTSIVRNRKTAEYNRVVLTGYVDRVPHLILPISRQNALRMAPAETPNS